MFHLNGGNDLATVLISAMCICLLVKHLLSVAKVQKRRNLHAKIVIKNIKSNNKYQEIFCLFVFFHYICSESKLKKAWCMRLVLSQNNYATLEMRKKLSYRGN